MKLPPFLARFTQGKKKKDYLFAIEIGKKRIMAAVWYMQAEKIEIIGTGTALYEGGWDEIIAAADSAITAACGDLPNSDEITKVILGLSPEFVDGDRIVSQYLAEFKRLCKELSLHPVGFVVIPEAIMYLLGKEDGVPQTAILAGIDNSLVTLSLFKVGKAMGMVTVTRSDKITADFEQGLVSFANVEVLPSKIILYDEGTQLDPIRDELLNHPWKTKAAFLHFPKIEILKAQTVIEAIAAAGAEELTKLVPALPAEEKKEAKSAATSQKTVPQESLASTREEDHQESQAEAREVPAEMMTETSFGFVKDRDIAVAREKFEPETAQPALARELPKTRFSMPQITTPKLRLPSLLSERFPGHGARIAAVMAILLIVLFGGIAVSLYWTIPTATVKLLVDPDIISQNLEVKLDTTISEPDLAEKRIPATVVTVDLDGSETAPATGKKTVGDPAHGQVTIYNKTTNEKTFPRGAVIAGPKNLQFTLDEEVSVASVSDVFAGIAGKALAKVTATGIGSDGNLPPSSDFSFKDFPVTLYAARNEQAFSGGTSREVQVVAKSDVDAIVNKMTEKLTGNAREKLTTDLPTGSELLPESIQIKVNKRVFNHEIGSEAHDFNTQLSVKATATAYHKADIGEMVRRDIGRQVPPNFILASEEPVINVSTASVAHDGSVTFAASVRAKIIPVIAKDEIKKKIVGQTLSQADKILRGIDGIVGFEVVFTKELPFVKKSLPKLAQNLTVEIQSR